MLHDKELYLRKCERNGLSPQQAEQKYAAYLQSHVRANATESAHARGETLANREKYIARLVRMGVSTEDATRRYALYLKSHGFVEAKPEQQPATAVQRPKKKPYVWLSERTDDDADLLDSPPPKRFVDGWSAVRYPCEK